MLIVLDTNVLVSSMLKHNSKPARITNAVFVGEARQTGSSHRVYKTPWQGDPRINIQDDKGREFAVIPHLAKNQRGEESSLWTTRLLNPRQDFSSPKSGSSK